MSTAFESSNRQSPNQQHSSNQQSSLVNLLPDAIVQFLLGAYLVLSQWNPSDSVSVAQGDSLYLILLGIVLGLFTAVDRLLTKQEHRISLNWKLLVTGFFVWLMFATLQTAGKGDLRIASLGFWQSVSLLGVVSCFYCQAMKHGRLESTLRWMIGVVAGTVACALYQYLVSFPAMRADFTANRAAFFETRGITLGSAEAMQWESRLLSTEPLGPFALTNSLAGFVGPWFVITIAVIAWILIPNVGQNDKSLLNSREWIRKFPSFFLSLWVLAIGSGAVLMLTKSRTGWLAFMITSIVLFLGRDSIGGRSWNHIQRYRAALAPVLVLLGIVGGIFLWRDPEIVNEAGKSFAYRMQYWRGSADIVESSPLFGVGPLNFQNAYPAFKELTASETPADPHNMWAEIATTGGVPLLVLAAIAAAGILQLFALNLARESSSLSDEQSEVEKPQGRLQLLDFGAAFGLVCIVAFSFLASDVDSMIGALLFAGATFYVSLTLSASAWVSFVRDNKAKIGLVLCTFMAIHLFFSGGWMQPGCMNTFLIGASLAFVSSRKRPARTEDLHEWSPWIPTFLWTGLLLTYVFSCYIPESKLAMWKIDNSLGAFNNFDSERWGEMLGENSYSVELADATAMQAMTRAMQPYLGEPAKLQWVQIFTEASAEIAKRSPKNWALAYGTGSRALNLAQSFVEGSEIRRDLESLARLSFERARELNPMSVTTQLQASVMDEMLGNHEDAKLKLDQVELIENSTPHSDKKLVASHVYLPKALITRLRIEPADIIDADAGLVKSEPVFLMLRSSSQPSR